MAARSPGSSGPRGPPGPRSGRGPGSTPTTPREPRLWYNQNGVIGVTVTNHFVSPAPKNPAVESPAAYAIYADQGDWTEQRATSVPMSLFSNVAANKVVVAALPHNIDLTDTAALTAALQDLEPYAWQRIVDTKLQYPPVAGSKTSVTVNGQTPPLGYDTANSVLRSQLEVTTEDFKTGGPAGTAMQLVFPHHREAMIAADKANIPQANGAAKYTWKSVNGELQAYVGNSYVRNRPPTANCRSCRGWPTRLRHRAGCVRPRGRLRHAEDVVLSSRTRRGGHTPGRSFATSARISRSRTTPMSPTWPASSRIWPSPINSPSRPL